MVPERVGWIQETERRNARTWQLDMRIRTKIKGLGLDDHK